MNWCYILLLILILWNNTTAISLLNNFPFIFRPFLVTGKDQHRVHPRARPKCCKCEYEGGSAFRGADWFRRRAWHRRTRCHRHRRRWHATWKTTRPRHFHGRGRRWRRKRGGRGRNSSPVRWWRYLDVMFLWLTFQSPFSVSPSVCPSVNPSVPPFIVREILFRNEPAQLHATVRLTQSLRYLFVLLC